MYQGHLDKRYPDTDPNGLKEPRRERTDIETNQIAQLFDLETDFRKFLNSLPQQDIDPRSKSAALTKLDELVMWATRAIDR